MPRVFISTDLRALTGGSSLVEVPGSTVRQVVDALEAMHPGIAAKLVVGDRLRSDLLAVVDSRVSSRGLRETVQPDSEIQFLPSIGGG